MSDRLSDHRCGGVYLCPHRVLALVILAVIGWLVLSHV